MALRCITITSASTVTGCFSCVWFVFSWHCLLSQSVCLFSSYKDTSHIGLVMLQYDPMLTYILITYTKTLLLRSYAYVSWVRTSTYLFRGLNSIHNGGQGGRDQCSAPRQNLGERRCLLEAGWWSVGEVLTTYHCTHLEQQCETEGTAKSTQSHKNNNNHNSITKSYSHPKLFYHH